MSAGSDTLHDPLETLCIHPLHRSPSVSVYDVRCRPHDKQRGPEERPLSNQVVFPRRGVFEIEAQGEKVIADANRVLFFNRDQVYRVAHPAGAGDDCTVFAFDDRLLLDVLEESDPAWLDGGPRGGGSLNDTQGICRPFRFAHGLNDARTSWAHERLRRAAQQCHPDSLAMDEAAVGLLAAVFRCSDRAPAPSKPVRTNTQVVHSDVVRRASLYLATGFAENASLDDVGRAVHASPFHLARLFRAAFGLTIHQYRHRLRLHAALSRIADGEANLSELALDLGFSSHSHLTDSFRAAFGASPAECRKSLNLRRLREMSRILEVRPRPKT